MESPPKPRRTTGTASAAAASRVTRHTEIGGLHVDAAAAPRSTRPVRKRACGGGIARASDGARLLDGSRDPGPLVARGVVPEHGAVGAQRRRAEPAGDAGERRRVQATAQRHADRSVAEAGGNGCRDRLAEHRLVLGVAGAAQFGGRVGGPVRAKRRPVGVDEQDLTGGQAGDVAVARAHPVGERGGKVAGQGALVEPPRDIRKGEQRGRIAAKRERARPQVVVERLDTERVASAQQAAASRVPQGKGEVAVKLARRRARPSARTRPAARRRRRAAPPTSGPVRPSSAGRFVSSTLPVRTTSCAGSRPSG